MDVDGIQRLRLSHFRSYSYLDISIESKHIVLSGHNGAGKTNVLEAISLLAPGKGLRKAKLGELTQMGQNTPWAIHADLLDEGLPIAVATGQDPNQLARRILKLQGVAVAKHSDLTDQLTVNWMTPAMDRLFVESASHRRKFFDRCVVGLDPLHSDSLAKYEHAMRERSRLLKHSRQDPNWLSTLESTMVSESLLIAERRRKALDMLSSAQPFAKDNDAFPAAVLRFTEGVEVQLETTPSTDIEEFLLRHLHDHRHIDRVVGGAQVGAHKMDFTAEHSLKTMDAKLCSTGEQKLLLIWLVMAFVKLQHLHQDNLSMLLLDEVAAHLDPERRELLFKTLDTLKCQIWYSGTDASLFSGLHGLNHQLFSVNNSSIRHLI